MPSCIALTLTLTLALSSAEAPPRVVATIGTYTLTGARLDAFWDALPRARRSHYEAAGGKRAFLDALVEQKLLVHAATSAGITAKPEMQIALENAHDTILGKAYINDEVTGKIVTDEAMKKYYDDHIEGFVIPEMIEAHHILVSPFREQKLNNTENDDATNDLEAKEKIERIATELAAGADFEDLARKWSEDVTSTAGGKLDPFPRGRLSKPLEDVAFTIEPGKVSDVIRTPYGFHLLMVSRKIAERTQTFNELLPRIQMAGAQESRDAVEPRYREVMETLKKTIEFTVDYPELATSSTQPTK